MASNKISVRAPRFLPDNLDLKPKELGELIINPDSQIHLVHLFGHTGKQGKAILAYDWGALRVATYGAGFTNVQIKTDTTPSAYSSSHEISLDNNYFQRIDILVEAQDAVVRFELKDTLQWSGDIIIPTGYHSIEFSTRKVQIKDRYTSGGNYSLIGYY